LALGTEIPLEGFDSPVLTLSPDGRYLAYVGRSSTGTLLFLRETGNETIAPVAGTEGAIYAFFSPDSRWLGFLTNDKLKKVALAGGAPMPLCDARQPVSATWTRGDVILFGEDEGEEVSRVSADGGRSTVVVPARESGRYVFSQALPDGRAVLMTSW